MSSLPGMSVRFSGPYWYGGVGNEVDGAGVVVHVCDGFVGKATDTAACMVVVRMDSGKYAGRLLTTAVDNLTAVGE